jgi:anthranilate synthase component I
MQRIALSAKTSYRTIEKPVDFYKLFQKIETQFDVCFLLESLGQYGGDCRYSVIGFGPDTVIHATDNSLCINEKEHPCANPYFALRDIMPERTFSRSYAGGLVGFMSYESVNFTEPSVKTKVHPDFDQFAFGVYTDGLIRDKMTGETQYFHHGTDRFHVIEKLLLEDDIDESTYHIEVMCTGDSLAREQHRMVVEQVKEEISRGNTFQCEVGMKSEYRIRGNVVPIYTRLREVNPSPHMYFMKFGKNVILGASPELLLRIRDNEIETFPLAGTIGRGTTESEDAMLAKELLSDPKEQAEHRMLVDLHRNDVGRVARFGTVKVRRYMEIKRFSHVQHISSEIAGIIRRDEDMFTALASVFPAGTLTGAPKIESMKIIDRNEPSARGPYGGAIGHFGFNRDCTFAIPIRTLFVSGEKAYTQTCGGIVAESDPDREYEELLRKRAAMDEAVKTFTVADNTL